MRPRSNPGVLVFGVVGIFVLVVSVMAYIPLQPGSLIWLFISTLLLIFVMFWTLA